MQLSIRSAFDFLYSRSSPHFDKTIEESIKAVETTFKLVLGKKGKLTGGKMAKELQKKYDKNIGVFRPVYICPRSHFFVVVILCVQSNNKVVEVVFWKNT